MGVTSAVEVGGAAGAGTCGALGAVECAPFVGELRPPPRMEALGGGDWPLSRFCLFESLRTLGD